MDPVLIVGVITAATAALLGAVGTLFAWRATVALERRITAQHEVLKTLITERPTTTALTELLTTQWEKQYKPTIQETVRAALPVDLMPALVIEALERIGVTLPEPAPVVPDEVLTERVRNWAREGVAMGYQARKNSPALTNIDAFRLAQGFVQEMLAVSKLEFPPRRLAQLIEVAVAEWNNTVR